MERLRAENEALRQELRESREMNEAPQFQSTLHKAAEEIRLQQIAIDQLRQQVQERTDQGAQLPDLEGVRDRILSNLKLGTQAPGYKVARRALDQFIRELSHE